MKYSEKYDIFNIVHSKKKKKIELWNIEYLLSVNFLNTYVYNYGYIQQLTATWL